MFDIFDHIDSYTRRYVSIYLLCPTNISATTAARKYFYKVELIFGFITHFLILICVILVLINTGNQLGKSFPWNKNMLTKNDLANIRQIVKETAATKDDLKKLEKKLDTKFTQLFDYIDKDVVETKRKVKTIEQSLRIPAIS